MRINGFNGIRSSNVQQDARRMYMDEAEALFCSRAKERLTELGVFPKGKIQSSCGDAVFDEVVL